jgi:superfamily II DNA or RNA helicase
MRDLFSPITRDERQEEAVRKWLQSKGHGTIVACTGFGKTRCSFILIDKLLSKYPTMQVLIVVPTEILKNQWLEQIDFRGLGLNVHVSVINTIAKHGYTCDLLIIDELHTAASNLLINVFSSVKYKMILGLTATFERLDERHKLIEKYCPVIDTITIQEAQLNGWVSKYNEYLVIIDVDDMDVYRNFNKEFTEHFEFFQFRFDLAMSMIGPKGLQNRIAYRDEICNSNKNLDKKEVLKAITYHATGFIRSIQNRKKFVYEHPEKIRIAEEIIKHRSDKKVVTFCANTKMAESFSSGFVYTGKESKKKNRISLEEFTVKSSGIMHTCKLAEAGVDIAGLSVGIMLGVNSSETKAVQTRGRVIRKEGNKQAEFFTLVINDTVELKWWENSHKKDTDIIKIDVDNLLKMLQGEPWEPYRKKLKDFTYRF